MSDGLRPCESAGAYHLRAAAGRRCLGATDFATSFIAPGLCYCALKIVAVAAGRVSAQREIAAGASQD